MKVVGVHGIAHTHLTAPQIEVEWLPALQGGLEEAGFARLAREDFAIAAYGALFRPAGTRAGDLPRLTAEDVTDEWEQALLLEWWREAAALSELNRKEQDPLGEDLTIQGPEFQGRGSTPEMVQRAIRQLTKSRYFEKLGGARLVLFALRQVREYLYNPEMKAAIQQRVVERVTEDTRVLIGHSLGSIVAYECLCAHPEWKVQTLVTLGSPLGISSIFNALTPEPVEGKGVWPPVKQWFNVADRGDIVALEKALAPRFGGVVDEGVHNGWESHSAVRYLNDQKTGRAIATGLTDTEA
ncbi:MAG: alpha/beta hydrolase [Oculatellaceae cyanobacterium Prado106]|nr:alpha/beta hydrolase [Oculatellaceae cyanobacterium Prado106]